MSYVLCCGFIFYCMPNISEINTYGTVVVTKLHSQLLASAKCQKLILVFVFSISNSQRKYSWIFMRIMQLIGETWCRFLITCKILLGIQTCSDELQKLTAVGKSSMFVKCKRNFNYVKVNVMLCKLEYEIWLQFPTNEHFDFIKTYK